MSSEHTQIISESKNQSISKFHWIINQHPVRNCSELKKRRKSQQLVGKLGNRNERDVRVAALWAKLMNETIFHSQCLISSFEIELATMWDIILLQFLMLWLLFGQLMPNSCCVASLSLSVSVSHNSTNSSCLFTIGFTHIYCSIEPGFCQLLLHLALAKHSVGRYK